MVNDTELAAQTLLAVVSQRLLRKLCLECREAYMPDAALLKKLNLPADKIKNSKWDKLLSDIKRNKL